MTLTKAATARWREPENLMRLRDHFNATHGYRHEGPVAPYDLLSDAKYHLTGNRSFYGIDKLLGRETWLRPQRSGIPGFGHDYNNYGAFSRQEMPPLEFKRLYRGHGFFPDMQPSGKWGGYSGVALDEHGHRVIHASPHPDIAARFNRLPVNIKNLPWEPYTHHNYNLMSQYLAHPDNVYGSRMSLASAQRIPVTGKAKYLARLAQKSPHKYNYLQSGFDDIIEADIPTYETSLRRDLNKRQATFLTRSNFDGDLRTLAPVDFSDPQAVRRRWGVKQMINNLQHRHGRGPDFWKPLGKLPDIRHVSNIARPLYGAAARSSYALRDILVPEYAALKMQAQAASPYMRNIMQTIGTGAGASLAAAKPVIAGLGSAAPAIAATGLAGVGTGVGAYGLMAATNDLRAKNQAAGMAGYDSPYQFQAPLVQQNRVPAVVHSGVKK